MKISFEKTKFPAERDKCFPGKVRWCDLKNARYISRKPIYDFIVENAPMFGGKLLDFGCGSMQYKHLFSNAEEYVGLDVENAEENGFHAEGVEYYDGEHIPFEKSTFDSVIAIETLEHVQKIDSIIEQIYGILKAGGVFMITAPMTFPLHLEPWDYRRFTAYGLKEILQIHGYTDITIKRSTATRDTLRRIKLIELRDESKINGRLLMLYTIFVNYRYAFHRVDASDSKMPLNYLVTCRKPKDK